MTFHAIAECGGALVVVLLSTATSLRLLSRKGKGLARSSDLALWLSLVASLGLFVLFLSQKPEPPPQPPILGYPAKPHSEATFSTLLRKDPEERGYGLYSYLLFGSPPLDDDSREKYIAALQSISSLQPTSGMLNYGFTRQNLNITYVPLTKAVVIESHPTDRATAIALLNAYNFQRARLLIDKVNSDLRGGPYIISVSTPLSLDSHTPDKFLFQDLSSATPKVVQSWVLIFESESAKPNFWEPDQASRFVANLRSVVDVTAHQIMPNMPSRIAELIGWKDVTSPKKQPN